MDLMLRLDSFHVYYLNPFKFGSIFAVHVTGEQQILDSP